MKQTKEVVKNQTVESDKKNSIVLYFRKRQSLVSLDWKACEDNNIVHNVNALYLVS